MAFTQSLLLGMGAAAAIMASAPVYVNCGRLQAVRALWHTPDLDLHTAVRTTSMLQQLETEVVCHNIRDCLDGQTCEESGTSTKCVCPEFYTFSDGQCVATDTCAAKDSCDENATCSDGMGAAPTCTCNDGYYGDGDKCAPVGGKDDNEDGSANGGGGKYTFGPNTAIKLVLSRQVAGTVKVELGNCYSLFLDFEKAEDSYTQLRDAKLEVAKDSFTGNGDSIVLIHRDGADLTTLVYTLNPTEPEWMTAATKHVYNGNCTFSNVRVIASKHDPASISVSVTEDVEKVTKAE